MSRTLVIITCCRDMWGFEMLCKSMRKNLAPCKILIVLNEEEQYCDSWFFWFNNYIKTFLQPHDFNVLTRKDFFDFELLPEQKTDGWVNQQILKILAAQHIDTTQYLCLDSKNFFFRKTSIENIKQVEQTVNWLHPWLISWSQNVCMSMNIEFTGRDSFYLTQNITPFIINTAWCREMIDFYKGKESFFKTFYRLKLPHDTCSPSEFIMYDIFCKKKNYINYDTVKQNCAVIWEHSLQEINDLDAQVLQTHKQFGVCVSGFHNGLKGKFSISHCVKFLNRLGSRNFMPTSVKYPF